MLRKSIKEFIKNINRWWSIVTNETTYDILEDHLISQEINAPNNQETIKLVHFEDSVSDEKVINHLYYISEFHKKVLQLDTEENIILRNETGKRLEKYKLYVKKSKKHIKILKERQQLTLIESYILENGEAFIKRAEACIELIHASNYLQIIKRSMLRREICIGNRELKNIIKECKLQSMGLADCEYNMFEMDAVFYLNKIKKYGKNLSYDNIIENYCDFEEFDYNSKNFILAFISFPNEFMKWWNRYRLGQKKLKDEDYYKLLKEAAIKDGKALIKKEGI